MGVAFRPAVSTGARETLNLVVDRRTRCRAEDRATSRTEWPAEKTTKARVRHVRRLVNRATIEVPDHRHGH
jgi:hypothetical protein